jgi:hypothetical protein
MSNPTLFLCFRGDGPYWKDLLYVPAYPAGYTYAKWAFRYTQNDLVTPGVIAEFEPIKQKQLTREAILGVRFIGKPNLVLPLRKIEINWSDFTGGLAQFDFRVQALLDFTKFKTLESACLTLPNSEIQADNEVGTKLAFHSTAQTSALPWSEPASEDNAWAALIDLIAANTSVPLDASLKSSTFFRLSNVLDQNNTPLTATELEAGPGNRPVFGALLKEGQKYQIKLTHRNAGDHKGTAPILPIKLDLPTGHLQFTRPALEILGWYQITPIAFKALKSSTSHQILLIHSDTKTGSNADAKEGATAGAQKSAPDNVLQSPSEGTDVFLPVPLRVQIGWLHRLKTSWSLRIGLAVVLTIQASIAYFRDFFDKLLEGKASLTDLIHYWPIILTLLALGAVASLLVSALQDQTKPKD